MIGSLVGSYKITDKIGEGGMGAVFRGIDVMLEREVAIKMLRPELSRQPNIVERFRSEAVTLAKLNHPNIATLYSFVRQGDDFFMVMEFVRGETLDRLIRRSGAMPCDRAITLFCQALEGIDHAHRMGIIHRDIKPANMMLTETGTLKVMDFGIARVLGTARMTKQGNIVGTIEYMSPEQVRGEETDARSDVYSLGILLYEMVTRRVPFNSGSEFELMRSQIEDAPPPPRTFASHIPLATEQAIMHALAKKPQARHRTAGEFRAALLNGTPAVRSMLDPKVDLGARVPRAIEPITTDPTSGEVMKETRLAGESGSAAVAIDSQIKETRLGQPRVVQPVYVQSRSDYVQDQTQVTQPASRSPLRRLNWKHYTSAAVVLVVLIGGLLWAVGVGKRQAAPQPSAVGQPESAPIDTPTALTPDSPGSAAEPNAMTPLGETPTAPNSIGQAESGIVLIPESPTANKRSTGGRSKSDSAARAQERRRKATEAALDKP
jgi:serine/threonine protein kinase